MGLMEKFFGKSAAITSAMIRAEIDRARDELTATRTELSTALGGIAIMSDSEHQKADERAATLRRAVARFEAKIAGLESELPAVIAAEEAAAAAAANEALRQRAEAARKASTKEAAKLLAEYDSIAAKIGDILSRLGEINTETVEVNKALRLNPINIESVPSYADIHRKHPDSVTEAVVENKMCWVTTDPATGGETARPADTDARGNFVPPFTMYDTTTGTQKSAPGRFERREVVTIPERRRAGALLHGLNDVRLPPGSIATGGWHWPRQS